ncbi:MAG TPA: DUF2071 domain-containing protein [Gemmatimonadales bacterium]|nr:DUF2071 domain-containing protein [Gemmatimonadales bacterium]
MIRPFLTAEWRHLVMVNYEVDAGLLEAYVPAGTQIDRHGGHCYASIVAFQFLNTRVLGLPIPFHRDFSELNLRFYVRRTAPGEVRRGVVFIREVVPRRAIALIARAVYNEPYVTLPMRSSVDGAVRHEWSLAGRWQGVSATPTGDAVEPLPGSHEEFITHHEWGYTRQRDGGTIEYRVVHDRWAVRRVAKLEVSADFRALYGPALGAALTTPATAFVIDGSPVTVGAPSRSVP